MSINVCVATDDNYAKYAGVVIASIGANASSEDNINAYILDGGISAQRKFEILSLEKEKLSISFIAIDDEMFEDYKKVKTHGYLSLPAFYRLKLPTLLPSVDKIIYFDCDIVVNSDLHDLFAIDMADNLIAGVNDIKKSMLRKNPYYVNSGMLVFNLKQWREENVEDMLLEYTKQNMESIKLGDQEILNSALKGRIQLLDEKWNVQSSNFTNRSSYTNKPKVIHFVAKNKPWKGINFSYHRQLYFKYLQLTPWKLSEDELKYWLDTMHKKSLVAYLKYRPLFFLRPRFYKALFYTYILKNQ